MKRRFVAHAPLFLISLIGLVFRLLWWNKLPRTGFISDEGEYLAAATWLADGRNFTWYHGYLWTRAPIYPLFVAAHLWLFGDPRAVYVTQTLLSLVNIALVYALAAGVAGKQRLVPVTAALLMALYLPFATYTQVLLSETLYLTLLLGGFAALGRWTVRHHLIWLVMAGALFGLATLTRSLTLAFLPIVAGWLVMLGRRGRGGREIEAGRRGRDAAGRRVARVWRTLRPYRAAGAFVAVAALVVVPWTVYNSVRLYGGLIVVDTTGAYNLALGARTAHDGSRADAPTRNFALALLNQMKPAERAFFGSTTLDNGGSCLNERQDARLLAAYSRVPVAQAELQGLLTAEGVCLIERRPLAFIAKSAGEFIDFFQINYSGDERFTDGFTLGRLPPWYALALFLLDDTLYVLVLPLAALGVGLRIARRRTHAEKIDLEWLMLLWIVFNLVVAPVLFAINRFRLPLLPFVFIFAAYALANLSQAGRGWWRTRGGLLSAGVALALFLVAATPYAYFEPRPPGKDSKWASYLGPYPSSLVSTWAALAARPDYLQQEQMRLALRVGDIGAAEAARPPIIRMTRLTKTTISDTLLVDALFAAAASRPADGLALLPDQTRIIAGKDVEAAVARGDMLRSLNRDDEARVMFGQSNGAAATGFVDDANPVAWAWDWLAPRPTTRIDFGSDLDLGYGRGCYLGEGDDTGTYRWCTDGAQMRFPAAGTGAAQTLVLRADGRGWRDHASVPPPVRVFLGDTEVGNFTPTLEGPQEFTVALPATPAGTEVVITLRTPTFIPGADDFNNQQGPQASQVRQLGVRLDSVELRSSAFTGLPSALGAQHDPR